MQLRDLGGGAGDDDGVLADAGEGAFFSEPKADTSLDAVTPAGPCGIL